MRLRARTLLPLVAGMMLGGSLATSPIVLVICSPGSAGNTVQAQPTLDAFAAAVQSAALWPAGSLSSIYFEQAEPGKERLSHSDAALALVSSPFYFEFRKRLSLQPVLEAVPEAGRGEVYSLVAKKGGIQSPTALSGWEITGGAGFSPEFVRSVLLADWGSVPADARITFSARPLTSLRRAASGEKLAVLLDREQAAALGTLPFAADLEVVQRSGTVPSGLLCLVSSRLPKPRMDALVKALRGLKSSAAGRAALKSLRLSGFEPVDPLSLKALAAPSIPASGFKP